MTNFSYTLVGDGSSDKALLCIIDWIIRQNSTLSFISNFGCSSNLRTNDLAEKIRRAVELYPCDILFVHRDSERADAYGERIQEIQRSTRGVQVVTVPIVPIRMTEAWLLFSEEAIRGASGNPNGRMPLDLPSTRHVERVVDPKELVFEKLKIASGLNARRVQRFNVNSARSRIAEIIDDFSQLRVIPTFESFERATIAALGGIEGAA